MPGGAKTVTACVMLLRVAGDNKDFNLVVSALATKPPNLIHRQIFWPYGIYFLLKVTNRYVWSLPDVLSETIYYSSQARNVIVVFKVAET